MRKYVLAFFVLTLLLSACRIESNVTLDIKEDGSATAGVEIGIDEEMLDLMGQSGGGVEDLLSDLPDFGGEVGEVTNRTDGDMTYTGVVANVDDLSKFDFGGDTGPFTTFSYSFDEESATLNATLESTGDDLGGGDLPLDPTDITDELFSANVLITMPGTVTESNADEVRSDGTLVWKLSLTETTEIRAVSSFGGSSTPWIPIILGIVLVGGIGAAIAVTVLSRKQSESAVAAAADTAAVADDTPAPEPDASDAAPEADTEPPVVGDGEEA